MDLCKDPECFPVPLPLFHLCVVGSFLMSEPIVCCVWMDAAVQRKVHHWMKYELTAVRHSSTHCSPLLEQYSAIQSSNYVISRPLNIVLADIGTPNYNLMLITVWDILRVCGILRVGSITLILTFFVWHDILMGKYESNTLLEVMLFCVVR